MFAVVTVSDRASQDASFDRSGPVLKSELEAGSTLRCFSVSIVPDDRDTIQSIVKQLCGEPSVELVLTTGGTGFGQRDVTPEAIGPLLEREASGLVHLLISSSLAQTPFAALARPVAGTIGKTLVITLPGSVKAVKESVSSLLNGAILQHALDLIRGGTGESVHQQLATQDSTTPSTTQSHSHHHHHHHHHHHGHDHSHGGHSAPQSRLARDPSSSIAQRQRESPFPLVSFDDAVATVLRTVPVLQTVTAKVTPALRGHVLAEDVHAPQDIPTSMTTNADGYALRSTDPAGTYLVESPSTWRDGSVPIPEGHIYRINTGAPLPAGCDSVIMVEDTQLVSSVAPSDGSGVSDEKEVKTLAQVDKGENVRMPGSDVKAGDLVISRGTLITALGGEIGAIAFVGKREVQVNKKPVIALLSTGNELSDIQAEGSNAPLTEAWSGVFDTNRPSLHTILLGLGYEVIDFGIVPDTFTEHRATIQSALQKADVVVTTGGSSMGSSDLLKPVIEDLGGVIHFGRVSVKPGKPTAFATVAGTEGAPEKVIFALPGNPASAIVCFNLFVIPALRRMGGYEVRKCQLPRVRVEIQDSMRVDPRPEFHRVVIRRAIDGALKAFSTGGQRSSRAASLASANGLVALPALKEGGRKSLEKGETVECVVIGEIEME